MDHLHDHLQFGAEAITPRPDFMLQNSFFGMVNVSFNDFFSHLARY